jgi:hypothetical protein
LSTHENLDKELDFKTSSDRSFGFVFAFVFFIVGIFPYFRNGSEPYIWGFITSAIFLLFAIAMPHRLAPLNSIWTKFGLLLQKVISPIVLGAMFFLVITPFGLVMRLMGKDLLRMKLDESTSSYWIPRSPPGPAPDSMKNQY